jgi:hypothetical protein
VNGSQQAPPSFSQNTPHHASSRYPPSAGNPRPTNFQPPINGERPQPQSDPRYTIFQHFIGVGRPHFPSASLPTNFQHPIGAGYPRQYPIDHLSGLIQPMTFTQSRTETRIIPSMGQIQHVPRNVRTGPPTQGTQAHTTPGINAKHDRSGYGGIEARVVPQGSRGSSIQFCRTCKSAHAKGKCLAKLVRGLDHCRICGIAHFGISSSCPHLASVVELRLMLDALNRSKEPQEHIELARAVLTRELGLRNGRRSEATP